MILTLLLVILIIKGTLLHRLTREMHFGHFTKRGMSSPLSPHIKSPTGHNTDKVVDPTLCSVQYMPLDVITSAVSVNEFIPADTLKAIESKPPAGLQCGKGQVMPSVFLQPNITFGTMSH